MNNPSIIPGVVLVGPDAVYRNVLDLQLGNVRWFLFHHEFISFSFVETSFPHSSERGPLVYVCLR